MDEKRKKLLDSILAESYKMVRERTEPVTEEELVEHLGIGGSFDFGFLCGYLRCKEQMMAKAADAMIGLPYENKDGGYTHLVDVSRPLPVGDNKIAIIFKED